jgi:hypothetical protein
VGDPDAGKAGGPSVTPGRGGLDGRFAETADGLHHTSAPQTPGADVEVPDPALVERAHALEIGIPAALGGIVRVADRVTPEGALATDVTALSQ